MNRYPTAQALAEMSDTEVIALADAAYSELVAWGCYPERTPIAEVPDSALLATLDAYDNARLLMMSA
jgi:hypothetical protein